MSFPALAFLLMPGYSFPARNNQIHMLMKTTETKELYISPECEEIDVHPEGIIAASDIKDIPYGDSLFS